MVYRLAEDIFVLLVHSSLGVLHLAQQIGQPFILLLNGLLLLLNLLALARQALMRYDELVNLAVVAILLLLHELLQSLIL